MLKTAINWNNIKNELIPFTSVVKEFATKMLNKSVSAFDSFKQTALHYAIFKADFELIDLLRGHMESETIKAYNVTVLTPLQQALKLPDTILGRKKIWNIIVKKVRNLFIPKLSKTPPFRISQKIKKT